MPEQKKIICRIVVEILGKPEQHVVNTLKLLLKKLKEDEKGVKITKGTVHKPKKEENFFSAFAEIEIEIDDLSVLSNICFDYMPSSVEIIEPESMELKSVKLSDFVNDLMARLHDVDMRLKSITTQNLALDDNCFSLLKNIVVLSLKQKQKTLREMEADVGIPENQLQVFVKRFVEEGFVEKKGDKYALK